MSISMDEQVYLVRTMKFGTGCRGVLYLPDGTSVHTLEDTPIPPGRYFFEEDDTGTHKHFVIEKVAESRIAKHAEYDYLGHEVSPAVTDVEVHIGNALSETDACVLVGMSTTVVGVGSSAAAIGHMREVLGRDDPGRKHRIIEIVDSLM